jgi:hypothetical protein
MFRVTLSAYFICRPVRSSETNYVGSGPAIGIFLYVAQSCIRKQTTLFRVPQSAYFIYSLVRFSEMNYVVSSPAIGILLYVA